VLDSPPVVPVSDPLQYIEAVDGVLYLLMAGRTPQDVVIRGIEILRGVGAHILGVIANNVAEVLPYYYDRKYYGYEERKRRAAQAAAKGAPAAGAGPPPPAGVPGAAKPGS
jgi:Mrp family chromosome partitioning ATPase